jgi:Bacterial dnaA protein helix-turn-helix
MRIEIKDIQLAVAVYFAMKPDQLLSVSHKRAIARPRQIAMFLAYELSGATIAQIGRRFYRDHTTVLHALEQIAVLIDKVPAVASAVSDCRILLKGLGVPTLEDLAIAHNIARKKVMDWVDQQARSGRLVKNDQAPDWQEYRAAIEKLLIGVANVGLGDDGQESANVEARN